MTSLWVLVVAVTVMGALALVVALRHVHHEIEPTVRAFAAFRDALRPAVAGFQAEHTETRERLDLRTRAGAPHPQG